MKIKNLLQITPAILAMTFTFPLFAEDPSPVPSPAASGREAHGDRPAGDQGGRPSNLTPEERDKLKAARQKAMEDPKVQEAQKALQEAMKAAMLAADPTIGPLLDKMGSREHGPGGEGRHRGDGDKAASPAASVSPEKTP